MPLLWAGSIGTYDIRYVVLALSVQRMTRMSGLLTLILNNNYDIYIAGEEELPRACSSMRIAGEEELPRACSSMSTHVSYIS